eukprot:COSAG05_NODE_25_length_31349_cov_4.978560_22_plen_136_part_00
MEIVWGGAVLGNTVPGTTTMSWHESTRTACTTMVHDDLHLAGAGQKQLAWLEVVAARTLLRTAVGRRRRLYQRTLHRLRVPRSRTVAPPAQPLTVVQRELGSGARSLIAYSTALYLPAGNNLLYGVFPPSLRARY